MNLNSHLRAFWFNSSNFGDNCNRFILEFFSGVPVVFTDISEPLSKLVSVGSILNWCDDTCVAWGPGLASITDCVNPAADLRAVRGPLSRERAKACGNLSSPALGDPALLLPLIFPMNIEKRFRTGIVPHYVDQLTTRHWLGQVSSETKILNVLDSPKTFLADLLSCEQVVSSSLHGIIAAHAFGIPACWVEFGGKIGGDGMKYRDYFQSVGLEVNQARDLSGLEGISAFEKLVSECGFSLPKISRVAELLQSMPFRSVI